MGNILLLAQESNVQSFFAGFDSEQRFVLTIIGIGCVTLVLVALGSVLAGVWSAVRTKQIETDLKRDMLDRGMSAEEIEKVISAMPQSGFDRWLGSWCKR